MADLNHSRRNRPTLRLASRNAKNLIALLFAKYAKHRTNKGERKMNAADVSRFERHLEIVVTDVFAAWNEAPAKYVGYSRGKENFTKGGSYWNQVANCPLLSQVIFTKIIDFLHESSLIENHTAESGYSAYSSRMRATPELIKLFDDNEVNWATITDDNELCAVVVKDEDKRPIDLPNKLIIDLSKKCSNLRRINKNLEFTYLNLNVTDEELKFIRRRMAGNLDDDLMDQEDNQDCLDFTNRHLRRIFAKSSLEFGGRFYGGWWQGLPNEYRKFIEIDGAVTREMDYSTMQARVLYAKVGVPPPDDSYIIPGWDAGLRKVIKKAFNQLINSKEGMRNEAQWRLFAPNLDPDPLPDEWEQLDKFRRNELRRTNFRERTGRDYVELLRDLKAMHEPIDKFFFSQAWTWLQRIDSDIAEMVMLRLLDEGHTVLPIHDSFIVRRSAEGLLREAMNEAFDKFVGIPAVIDEDESIYDRKGDRHFVNAHEIKDEAFEDLKDRSLYYQRQAQWEQVWGPST